MDINQPNIAPSSPYAPAVPVQPVPPVPEHKKIFTPQLIAIIAIAVILIVVGIIGLNMMRPSEQTQVQVTTATTPIPTPTPARELSPLASQSAFLQFEASVATLSAALAGYNAVDQTLIPPTLVLPLGY